MLQVWYPLTADILLVCVTTWLAAVQACYTKSERNSLSQNRDDTMHFNNVSVSIHMLIMSVPFTFNYCSSSLANVLYGYCHLTIVIICSLAYSVTMTQLSQQSFLTYHVASTLPAGLHLQQQLPHMYRTSKHTKKDGHNVPATSSLVPICLVLCLQRSMYANITQLCGSHF